MPIRPNYLQRLKPFFAWSIAALIFYWLFRQTPPKLVWEALKQANWGLFVVVSIAYFWIAYLVDTLTLRKILALNGCDIPLGDFLALRGRSYYYAVLNYNAGQGLLAYYLKKNSGTSWLVAGGTIFYVMLTDFFILVSAVCLSLALVPADDRVWMSLKHTSGVIFLGMIGLLLAVKTLPRLVKPLAAKMANKSWYSFVYHYSWSHIAQTLFYRACYISVTVSGLYLPFLPFHVDVPFSYFIASTPPVFIIGALPITPSGLGTVQAAFVYFFSKAASSPLLAPGESPDNLLLALILAWAFANLLLKLSVGLYFNFKARRQI